MNIAYPFRIMAGQTGVTKSVKPQLSMLLATIPGTRLWDPNYGFNPIALEQELLDVFSPERTLFTIQLQENLMRYLPGLLIKDVTFEQGAEASEIIVNIYYLSNMTGEEDVFVWQPNSNLT